MPCFEMHASKINNACFSNAWNAFDNAKSNSINSKAVAQGVLTIYEKFKGKYLCQSVSFSKVAARGLQLYKERYSGTGEYCEMLKKYPIL